MSATYTAEYWDHRRDELKHEPRPGERDYVPLSAELPKLNDAVEVAILVKAHPSIEAAAGLIRAFVDAEHARMRLDAVAAGARP